VTLVEPAPATHEDTATVWTYQDAGLISVGVWTERRAGEGEDAEPTFLYQPASCHGLIGVYDGVGGSGAGTAGYTDDDRQLSQAYVASRLAHVATERWFSRVGEPGHADLRSALTQALSTHLAPGRSKVIGTMRHDFPTTVSLIEFRPVSHNGVHVTAHWAGDSRGYALTPHRGLQQLTLDDSDETDALSLLESDQPMSNMAKADGRFVINQYEWRLNLPLVLITATDGVFQYVATPAHVECVLLEALRQATDPADWGRWLAGRIGEYTADDASLSMVAIGFEDFEELRASFADRFRRMYHEHWVPFQSVDRGDRDALVAARHASWNAYHADYGVLLYGRQNRGDERTGA
jgi:hypothetical protein